MGSGLKLTDELGRGPSLAGGGDVGQSVSEGKPAADNGFDPADQASPDGAPGGGLDGVDELLGLLFFFIR